MADYVAPGVEDFLDRYPEFGGLDEHIIELVLAEADSLVGSTFIANLRVTAVLALAAHLLFSENQLAQKSFASASSGVGQVSGPITSMTVGPLTEQYKSSSGGGSIAKESSVYTSDLGSSPYGLRFLELLHLSEPAAILVV
jgi:hypothetical protein